MAAIHQGADEFRRWPGEVLHVENLLYGRLLLKTGRQIPDQQGTTLTSYGIIMCA